MIETLYVSYYSSTLLSHSAQIWPWNIAWSMCVYVCVCVWHTMSCAIMIKLIDMLFQLCWGYILVWTRWTIYPLTGRDRFERTCADPPENIGTLCYAVCSVGIIYFLVPAWQFNCFLISYNIAALPTGWLLSLGFLHWLIYPAVMRPVVRLLWMLMFCDCLIIGFWIFCVFGLKITIHTPKMVFGLYDPQNEVECQRIA